MEVWSLHRSVVVSRPVGFSFALGLLLLTAGYTAGQDVPRSTGDSWREPILPRSLSPRLRFSPVPDTAAASPNRDNHVRLFRMSTGYLVDPVGDDSDLGAQVPDQTRLPAPEGDSLSKVQIVAGNDNPYLDFRRPGDPGGVGYFRFQSQVQFLDTGKTGCTIGLKAAAP